MKKTFLRFPQDKVSTRNAIIHSQFYIFLSGRLICIIMTLQFQLLQFWVLFSRFFRMKSIKLCIVEFMVEKVFNLQKKGATKIKCLIILEFQPK